MFKNLVCLGQKHEQFSFLYLENIVHYSTEQPFALKKIFGSVGSFISKMLRDNSKSLWSIVSKLSLEAIYCCLKEIWGSFSFPENIFFLIIFYQVCVSLCQNMTCVNRFSSGSSFRLVIKPNQTKQNQPNQTKLLFLWNKIPLTMLFFISITKR